MGIEVLPPDVNESELDFAPVPGETRRIRYGLSAVRNVGQGVVAQIIEARRTAGAFTTFSDFCRKVEPSALTKKVLESLAYAGAFDSLGYHRAALVEHQEKVSAPIIAERRAEAAGQFSLFGGDDRTAAAEIDESVLAGGEFDRATLLRMEKEMLGQYVTDHPLLGVREELARMTDCTVPEAAELGDGDLVTVGGIVAGVQRKYTRNGEPYAVLRLEDLTGGIGVVAFPKVFTQAAPFIDADAIVLVKGRLDHRGREPQIRALEILEPSFAAGVASAPSGTLVVELRPEQCTPAVLGALRDLLAGFPGASPVEVHYVGEGGLTPLPVGQHRVDAGAGLLSELRILLGPGRARLEPRTDPASRPVRQSPAPTRA